MKVYHYILIICVGFQIGGMAHEDFQCSKHRSALAATDESEDVDVLNYSLKFDFSEGDDALHAVAMITFKSLSQISALQFDLQGLTIEEVVYHGAKTKDYKHEKNSVVINLNDTIEKGAVDSIRIHYGGKPNIDKSDFGGFYFREGFAFNLGVAFVDQPHVYGRSWFPCKDNFHDRATYDYTFITKKGERAFANGLRISEEDLGKDKTLTKWKMKTEIPTYLAAVYAGPYKSFEMNYHSELQGVDIPIMYVARPQEMGKLKGSFQNLTKSVAAFEKLFGPYNWEKIGYAIVPFRSGAMEHASLIAYPDDEADGTLESEDLMAHELSHHWWGNWVTCASAKEMWINEGMASFSEYLFYEAVYGKEKYLKALREDHYAVMQKGHYYDAGHYAMNEIPGEYTYGIHSYKKGATCMHTLRTYMGDEAFFKGLQYIQTTFGGRNISTEEFMVCMKQQDAIAQEFFDSWMLQPGSVAFTVAEFKTLKLDDHYEVFLKVRQTKRAAKEYFEKVPITVTLIAPDGRQYEERISSSGDISSAKIEAPFAPAYVGLNLDEAICGATTARSMKVNKTGDFDWSYANADVSISKANEESFLAIENHWVKPSGEVIEGHGISNERYWTVDGVGLNKIEGEINFHFNGETSRNGFIDFELFTYSNASMENLTLMYKSKEEDKWAAWDGFMVQATASNASSGIINVDRIEKGFYTMGYKLD